MIFTITIQNVSITTFLDSLNKKMLQIMSLPRHTVGSTENYWMQVTPNAIVSSCTTNGVCDKIFSSVWYSLILFPEKKKLIGWLHAHMDKNWRMASAERRCSWEDDIWPSSLFCYTLASFILLYCKFQVLIFQVLLGADVPAHHLRRLCLAVDAVPSYAPLWWASSELGVLCGGPLAEDLVL